jgi:hypothetical protein
MRDLEKLQAARMPAPLPQPVAVPAPVAVEAKQPAAVMMDTPSAAAHTFTAHASFQPKEESTRVAPFPDMGMSLNITDNSVGLGATDKPPTASAQVTAGGMKPETGTHATPPVKPSPKPKSPQKAAIVPSAIVPPARNAQEEKEPPKPKTNPPQEPPVVVQAAKDSSQDSKPGVPTTTSTGGNAATADMAGGEFETFTNMEFSLAPSSSEPLQNAPTAQMQDFGDMVFTAQDESVPPLEHFTNGDNASGTAPAGNEAPAATTTHPDQPEHLDAPAMNVDEMFDLDNLTSDVNMDLDLDLGDSGAMNDSAFDDMFYEGGNKDMGQFDDAFFGLE